LQRIAQAVNTKTQGGCQVQVQVVERMARTARGKHRMLIQHLDLSDYLGAAVLPGATPALASGADADVETGRVAAWTEERLWA
jgi:hypothetical protein